MEVARAFLQRATAVLDTKASDTVKLCAMAERVGTDTGFEVANKALQFHGGSGYLHEYGKDH